MSDQQTKQLLGVGLVVVFGLCYFLTGSDPLGLFTGNNGTSQPSSGIVQEQIVPEEESESQTPSTEEESESQAPSTEEESGSQAPSTEEEVTEPISQPETAPSGGDWWQVYFTDPVNINNPDDLSGSLAEQLIKLINNAEYSIHIASFEFNLTPVAEALIEARNRGVDVRWVTDDEHGREADEEEGHGQFLLMEQDGIEIRDDARSGLMHNKFWIFDDQIVWTGSTNITKNGNFRNNNNAVVIESADVAAIYEREFQELWDGEFGVKSTSTVELQEAMVDGTPILVLFGAEDDVISKLIPLVESAQKNIRFMAFSFTHDDLGAAVLDRLLDDVDVMGIFERRGSETKHSELTSLYCVGALVNQDGNPGTFHHKAFVIDEEIVITGSFNFSNNANKSNDENVIVMINKDIAQLYLQEFDRRWAESKEPDPEKLDCG